MVQEKILVLDFGGQYNQLIARRAREQGVYSEVLPYTTPIETIRENGYRGIILTGGPSSVNQPGSPACGRELFELGVPVLGICYGAQLMAHVLGGQVTGGKNREYGRTALQIFEKSPLFSGIGEGIVCWMSHTDRIDVLPEGFTATAKTAACPVAAMENLKKKLYAVQFHPEVEHTDRGRDILHNFLFEVCGCQGTWSIASFVEESVRALRERVGGRKVVLGLSGGVDSSVAAVLLHKAIGRNLTCIFVDHGLLRKDEAEQVETLFRGRYDMNLVVADARARFLGALQGVEDPERKRKIIGEEFIRVFESEAKKLGSVDYLAQGTIYPDVIESGLGPAAVIKSHHNVGGLPENIGFAGIIEPLRNLFKDEVRAAGIELGLPESMVWRQPFPGPGLAIRVIGEVTEERLALLREADAIFREEVLAAGLGGKVNQYFAVLTNMKSVGVMGDERTYDYTVALRAVTTTDFMTADWARLPYEVLEKVSSRIINEVGSVNRVVYDVTSKPPATIEWE